MLKVDLSGKVIIVTGASGELGKDIAFSCARCGARVVINYFRNEAFAQRMVDEIKGSLAIRADVKRFDQVKSMIDEVLREHGKVDALINNAGITRDSLLLKMKEKDWDEVLATNLKGVYICTKAVLSSMIKNRRGKIINISSSVGFKGNIGQANYAASKAGIIGFTRSLAKEVGRYNIKANVICPGFIKSKMTEKAGPKSFRIAEEKSLLGRISLASNVADFILFLLSPSGDNITGQVFNIDSRITPGL